MKLINTLLLTGIILGTIALILSLIKNYLEYKNYYKLKNS